MKKNKKNYIATLSLCGSLIASATIVQAIELFQSETTFINGEKMVSSDFESIEKNNNVIEDLGSQNYQFQDLVQSQNVNDESIYNGQNVLSKNSILTVRNENYYFNFIKDNETNNGGNINRQPYRIVATPVDPYSPLATTQIITDYYELNGSALWIKEHLIMAGTQENGQLLFTAYKQDENGQLAKVYDLKPSSSNYPQLYNLQNLTKKTIDTDIAMPIGFQGFETYETYAKPVYLSPVTNFQDQESNKASLLVWTYDNYLSIFNAEKTKIPVVLEFDVNTGFSVNNTDFDSTLPTTFPEDKVTEAGFAKFTSEQVLNSRIMAMSPIIDENGNFSIYIHSAFIHEINENNTIALVAISKVEVTSSGNNNLTMKVEQFSNDVITAGFTNINISRDPRNYLPYGIFARGDANGYGPDANLNLFYSIQPDNYFSVGKVGTNIVIDNQGTIIAPSQMQVDFFEELGFIFTNYLFIEQIYYPNEIDLEKGVKIGIRYRGVGRYLNVTRLGTLTWQTPWDEKTWSSQAAYYGTTIVDGYNASPVPISIGNVRDNGWVFENITPTVWNDVYSAPGIYQRSGQNAPVEKSKIQTLTRDLNTGFNVYHTEIPKNITIEDGINIDPNSIGTKGILDLILPYSKDIPTEINDIEIESIQNVERALIVKGQVNNPYINGIKSPDSEPLVFETKIAYPPLENEIETPIIFNSNAKKIEYPSNLVPFINQAFSGTEPIYFQDIIGLTNTEVFQVQDSMIPFVKSIESSADDFLGKLNVSYVVETPNGITTQFDLTINGYWGNVYIIAIVVGALLLIAAIVITIFALLAKKHKTNLTSTFSSAFKMGKLNKLNANPIMGQKTPIKPTMPSVGGIKPIVGPSQASGSKVPGQGPKPPVAPPKTGMKG